MLRRAAAGTTRGAGVTLGQAAERFLAREDLDAGTIRSYGQTLRRMCLDLGAGTPLAEVTAGKLSAVFSVAWDGAAAKTWNRHRAAVRSFSSWASVGDLSAGLDRKPESRERRPSIGPSQLDALWERPDTALREKALWRLLHESAAAARTALSLNVEDLDLDDRRGRVAAKNGQVWLSWQSGTARLLPHLVEGRTRGPLFLADRRPAPARMPGPADLCPDTGRGRLSYERAEYLFKQATRPLDPSGAGYTLHQLSHSRP
ncbi:site-specific integrase [Streptosporangium roseum]|uniref:site-specific integrase n=1 Tax=Streptosporangium roseum TaxID=2001 RepID=UPI003D9E826A